MSDVDLSVMPGERVGLVGQNGAGKSSLLQCIAGFRSTDEGRCLIKNGARMGNIYWYLVWYMIGDIRSFRCWVHSSLAFARERACPRYRRQ